MGNYKFEKDNNDFGQTRRLDTIHKEVQKIEKEIKNRGNNKSIPPEDKEDKVFGINKKLAVMLVIFCAVFIICGCFVISKMLAVSNSVENTGSSSEENSLNEENITENGYISCGIITDKKSKEITVLNTATGKTSVYELSNSTVITGANGGRISLKDLGRGDIVSITLSESGQAQQVRFPENAWYYQSVKDVKIDAASMTAEIDGKKFVYDNETIFSYNESDIYPGDIDQTDIITAYGIGENLLSAKIEEAHGYVVLKNADSIENIMVKVDFGQAQEVNNAIVPVSAGHHTILISGDNIDDYMIEVQVEENQQFEIDLGEFSEALRIIFDVNADNYNVNINGVDYPPNTTEAAVSRGVYNIIITAQGYEDFSTTVNCEKENAHVSAVLNKLPEPLVNPAGGANISEGTNTVPNKNSSSQGSLTIYTDPGWAKVYVDGEYIGVSPVMVKLDYGKHNVKAKDSQGNIEETDVNIDSPDKTVTLDF